MIPTASNAESTCLVQDPSRAFPVELWQQVFEQVVFSESSIFDIRATDKKLETLSQVCRFWRAALLAQPKFWSCIHLSDHDPPIPVSVVKRWLANSQKAPLSLRISGFQDDEVVFEFVDLFVPEAYRWKHINWGELPELPLESLCHLEMGSVNILESAQLDISHWPENLQVHVWNVIGSSPMLNNVSPTTFSAELPWHQLTRLETPEGLQLDTFLETLSKCRNLKSLHLSELAGDTSPLPHPIVLPHLNKLSMQTYDELGPRQILRNLVASNLTSLELTGDYGLTLSLGHYDAVEEFLSMSRCKLQGFTHSGHGDGIHTLLPSVSFFRSPSFTYLNVLYLGHPPEDLLRALIIPDTAPYKPLVLLPFLTALGLEFGSKVIEEGLIGSMVLSRVRAKSRLREVKVFICGVPRGSSKLDEGIFLALRTLGMDVEFQIFYLDT